MKITFGDLKRCIEEEDDFLIDYFNSFKGENTHQKFSNIIKAWEKCVSYTINFTVDGKNVKISLSYILEQLKNYSDEQLKFEFSGIKVVLDTPILFKKDLNILSISEFIHELEYLNHKIRFVELNEIEKNQILQNLPAEFYNKLSIHIINSKIKRVSIDHPSIPDMYIDFWSAYPYQMLRDLFLSYNIDYFRDLIYVLSKKIDGNILMDSTIMDIDYYLDKIKNDNISEPNINLA
jgi:hypothetical protein